MDCGASVGETQLIRRDRPAGWFRSSPELTLDALTTIEAEDIRQSRVFQQRENGA
jgi:hypothetical protein